MMLNPKPSVVRHLFLSHHNQERSGGELEPSQEECRRRCRPGASNLRAQKEQVSYNNTKQPGHLPEDYFWNKTRI